MRRRTLAKAARGCWDQRSRQQKGTTAVTEQQTGYRGRTDLHLPLGIATLPLLVTILTDAFWCK
eukprot:6206048-Pleurochrysis_carterae.AAC.2